MRFFSIPTWLSRSGCSDWLQAQERIQLHGKLNAAETTNAFSRNVCRPAGGLWWKS